MTKQMTIAEFCKANKISMIAERCDANPNMADSREMDHWCVKFVKHGAAPSRMTTYFSMGYGHNGARPKPAEVLDCLALDASGMQESFDDWCGNYGYDTDSRKAEKIYKACEKSAAKLKQFLGDELYEQLLYGTERE